MHGACFPPPRCARRVRRLGLGWLHNRTQLQTAGCGATGRAPQRTGTPAVSCRAPGLIGGCATEGGRMMVDVDAVGRRSASKLPTAVPQ
jgi:hypothetical protein